MNVVGHTADECLVALTIYEKSSLCGIRKNDALLGKLRRGNRIERLQFFSNFKTFTKVI